jgi:hypothetical protein
VFVLADNSNMLEMCRRLGFLVAGEASDPGMRRVTLDLRGS